MSFPSKAGGYTVYGLVCPKTGALRYVGQTISIRTRKSAHRRPPLTSDKSHTAWWKRSILPLIPKFVVLQECQNQVELDEVESFLISYFRCLGSDLTNHESGGNGGHKMDARAREKMSKAKQGKKRAPRTQEHKNRISAALKGRKLSAEHIAKIVISSTGNSHTKGYKHTDETKEKMAKAKRGRRHSQEAKDKMKGNPVGFYRHTQESLDKMSEFQSARHAKDKKLGRGQYTEEARKRASDSAKAYWKKRKGDL